jgi:hypothetical protein
MAEPRLFATITYLDILNYDLDRCTGGPQAESCDGLVGDPSYGSLDPTECYKIDLSPVKALDEGGRMDLLALSAYPDGLLMSVPGGPDAAEFHPPTSSGPEDCQNRLVMPSVVDPWDQLDRLDWDKPLAISETSSRSCTVWNWFNNSNGEGLLHIPGTPTTQNFWLDRALEVTENRPLEFMVQSLYEDYPPVGRPFLQNIDNRPLTTPSICGRAPGSTPPTAPQSRNPCRAGERLWKNEEVALRHHPRSLERLHARLELKLGAVVAFGVEVEPIDLVDDGANHGEVLFPLRHVGPRDRLRLHRVGRSVARPVDGGSRRGRLRIHR